MRRILAVLLAMAAHFEPPPLVAHESLYHYVEIRFPREKGGAELCVSVHAAELAPARALGVDPSGSDLAWMKGLDEERIAGLLAEARAFAAATFAVEIDGAACDGSGLRFPEPAQLRTDPEAGEAARPGFLVGALALEPDAATLVLRLSPESGKRLLLVLNRPGAFPEVRDLAPGDGATLSLAKPAP